MKKTTFLLSLTFVVSLLSSQVVLAQSKTLNDPKMDWWKEARFGMFIHWGLYAVPAGVWNGKDIPGIGEWIMLRGKIPMKDYQQLATQFNPTKFDADAWAKLAYDAGMKYLVITSKHHDGFAMFKSKDPFNIVDATPFKKDPIKELAAACKKYNIKFGLYYSQAQDWNHPGGAAASGGHWDSAQNGSMDKYIDEVAVPQVREILSAYNPAIIWWDTPTDMNKNRADKIANELKAYPNLITNNRLGGGYEGDLETPEQYIPATGIPDKNWESCMTMNGTWGFKSKDTNWKSTQVIIRNLIDIASKGGNYLLNVGPTQEGIIPLPSVERLKQVGEWLKVNGDAIYGSKASPFAYLSWGRATTKNNKLYLHVFDYPKDGKIKIPLTTAVTKAYLLSNPSTVIKTSVKDKYTYLELPATAADKIATVVVVELKGEAKSSLASPVPSFGKTVTASSTLEDKNDKWNTKNVVDNNSKTSWRAAATDSTAWLSIDLGEATSIGAVALTEAGGRSAKFNIEYKDGDTWKKIVEGKNIGNGFFKQFSPVKAREFRLNMLQAKAGGIEIKEFQLFYEE
jgi:alpha-L-fucosidase